MAMTEMDMATQQNAALVEEAAAAAQALREQTAALNRVVNAFKLDGVTAHATTARRSAGNMPNASVQRWEEVH